VSPQQGKTSPADLDDPYDLRRFEVAQDRCGIYRSAVSELRAGEKLSHWMWFIFPQIAGLGRSAKSRYYAISSLGEANAYVSHRVLGPRLVECTHILTQLTGRTAEDIFGVTDAHKLRSSMTLFIKTMPDQRLFQDVLNQYFDGIRDVRTNHLLDANR
jgi:uncharacterized protein (DUF1810 family)